MSESTRVYLFVNPEALGDFLLGPREVPDFSALRAEHVAWLDVHPDDADEIWFEAWLCREKGFSEMGEEEAANYQGEAFVVPVET